MTRSGSIAGSWGRIALLVLSGILLWSAWRAWDPPALPGPGDCTCALERTRNGWCASCERGWVASLEVRSKMLFEGLDAHGHEIDPVGLSCTTCRELARTGGFCEADRFGWVDGLAYMTRLTYHLARGRTRDLADVSCPGCRELAGGTGTCATCGTGWAGNVSFQDPADHQDAVREFARLRAAIEASLRCETCSLVLLVDATCPYCRIRYEDGVAVAEAVGR